MAAVVAADPQIRHRNPAGSAVYAASAIAAPSANADTQGDSARSQKQLAAAAVAELKAYADHELAWFVMVDEGWLPGCIMVAKAAMLVISIMFIGWLCGGVFGEIFTLSIIAIFVSCSLVSLLIAVRVVQNIIRHAKLEKADALKTYARERDELDDGGKPNGTAAAGSAGSAATSRDLSNDDDLYPPPRVDSHPLSDKEDQEKIKAYYLDGHNAALMKRYNVPDAPWDSLFSHPDNVRFECDSTNSPVPQWYQAKYGHCFDTAPLSSSSKYGHCFDTAPPSSSSSGDKDASDPSVAEVVAAAVLAGGAGSLVNAVASAEKAFEQMQGNDDKGDDDEEEAEVVDEPIKAEPPVTRAAAKAATVAAAAAEAAKKTATAKQQDAPVTRTASAKAAAKAKAEAVAEARPRTRAQAKKA